MQLTLYVAIRQVTTSAAFIHILKWYFPLLVCWWIFLLQLCRWLFLLQLCSYRNAKVYRIKCRWLSRRCKTCISQAAILLVGLTSRGKYQWGKNYAVQTRIKELILLSQKNFFKLKNSRFVCTLFILKCFILSMDLFFLSINWLFPEVRSQSLHLSRSQDGYVFNAKLLIQPYVFNAKLLIQSLEWLFYNFSEAHHFTDHAKNNWENPFCNMQNL